MQASDVGAWVHTSGYGSQSTTPVGRWHANECRRSHTRSSWIRIRMHVTIWLQAPTRRVRRIESVSATRAARYNLPVKNLILGVAAALILAIPAAAQFPPAAIVTTNIADVDKHVAAAKTAAGSEWVGLYTAACGDAVGLSQPAAPRGGGASAGRADAGAPGAGRAAGGAPAGGRAAGA